MKDIISNTYIITGSSRSGTSILGKIIGSLEKIIYIYEPPTLYPLFYNIKKIDKLAWKSIFECFLETYLLDHINGRNFNFNKNDDSYILNYKNKKYVNAKINNCISARKLYEKNIDYKIVIKLPDLIIDKSFFDYYPKIRVIYNVRNYFDNINSLFNKKWYEEKRASYFTNSKTVLGQKVPFFINKKNFNFWNNLNNLNKCAYHYIILDKNFRKLKNKYIIVNYDKLISNKNKELMKIYKYMQSNKTKITNEHVKNINRRKSNIYFNLKQITPYLRKKL